MFLWACVVSVSARSECLHNRAFRSVDCAGARLCSAGRSVSFMSPVQFSLKSGSKDERITLLLRDPNTHTCSHARTYPHTLMHTHRQQ